jgi:allantoin racemase
MRLDAAVVYITYDVGVDAAMSMVRIPVIGSGRVAYHTASLLGNKICVIAPYDSLIPLTYRAAQAFGFDQMITPIRALNIPVGRMREQKEKARARFIELAKQGIREGAQVIFPQGLNSISIHIPLKEVEEEIGCPIIDAVPLALRCAETFVSLGLTQSRLAYPLSG